MPPRLVPFLVNTTTGRYAESGATPFVVVFVARTGSNYLAAMLDSHPQVICHHEVFNPDGIHRSLTYKGTDVSFGTTAERDRNPWQMMRRIFQFTDGAAAVGFKMSPRENDWAFLSLLLTRRVRKIVLVRRNWLQAYTSGLIALETRVWSEQPASQAGSRPKPVKVTVDPAEFKRYVRKREAFYRGVRMLLALTGQRYFALDYDEIGNPGTSRRLLDFLGVSPDAPMTVRTAKQNPTTLAEKIENYAEVRSALAGTRYAAMLD